MQFNRAQLLDIIRKNREEHHDIFLEAQEGYRHQVVEALERNLKDAREGREIRAFVNLRAPVDQTKDYDRAIRMFELSVDTNIELDETQFANYIMDEWGWTQNFLATNSAYSVTAGSKMKG